MLSLESRSAQFLLRIHKIPVFFPVSRELKGERLEPDCSLYQQVCGAEKSARMAAKTAGNGRNFAILALKADRRKCPY
jgi:hypothetical protein